MWLRTVGREPIPCPLALVVAADFAVLFEVTEQRVMAGTPSVVSLDGDTLSLRHTRGELSRSVHLAFADGATVTERKRTPVPVQEIGRRLLGLRRQTVRAVYGQK